jgi:type II secretory pathway predicted ATPase ExeA
MTTEEAKEAAAIARNRLQAAHDKPETAHDHIANAAQCLIAAEAALERLKLMDNKNGDGSELRTALRNAQIRIFKALFLLNQEAR